MTIMPTVSSAISESSCSEMPTCAGTVAPRRQLHPRISLALQAAVMVAFLAASAAPTPLYALYRAAWGFSPVTLTIIFGSYAISLMAALLVAGSISEHVGRRPAILAALGLNAAAMVVFLCAGSETWLIAARIVQGFATGIATSAIAAAIYDLERKHGAAINGVAPISGMAIGALGDAVLVQFAPDPMHLVFDVFIVLFAVQATLIWFMPETSPRKPGAWRSLRPRVAIPPHARRTFLRVAPMTVAVWALGGFTMSLGPTLAREVTSNPGVLIGGGMVFCLSTSASLAILFLRGLAPRTSMIVASLALLIGVPVILAGVHEHSTLLFLAGILISGIGFGLGFLSAMHNLIAVIEAHERAGLLAAFYVLSYLALSIPAVLAGTMAREVGVVTTMYWYCGGLMLLILLALAGALRHRTIQPQ